MAAVNRAQGVLQAIAKTHGRPDADRLQKICLGQVEPGARLTQGNLFEGLLDGGEAEESATRVGAATADPLATAASLDAARGDPELSRRTGDYLERQGRLI